MLTRTTTLLITTVFMISACSTGEELVIDDKPFQYRFEGPKRTPVDARTGQHLGNKPEIGTAGVYYSANGHACKRLGHQRVACFIGGRWHESASIITRNR